MDWRTKAACYSTDPSVFFDEHKVDKARQVCARCTVRRSCLEYVIQNDIQWGVWAGMTATERASKIPRRTLGGGRVTIDWSEF